MMAARKALIGAAIIALAAVSSLAIAGCARSNPPVDASQLLKPAAAKQTVFRTYTYVVSSGQTPQTEDDPAVFASTVTGHVVADQGIHLKIQTTLGYVEHLVLPDKQYERNGPNEPWHELGGSTPGLELPKLASEAHAKLISNLEDVTVVGDEMLQNVNVTKITAHTNMERKAEQIWGDIDQLSEEVQRGISAPRNQVLAGQERFTAWIGKDDGLIHQYSIYGIFPAYGDLEAYETWRTVTFSNFNVPFNIPAPQSAATDHAGDGADSAANPTRPQDETHQARFAIITPHHVEQMRPGSR